MKMTKELADNIMKAALVALMSTSPARRQRHGLRRGVGIETIRQVYQNLPEVDLEYIKAKDIIMRASKHFEKEMKKDVPKNSKKTNQKSEGKTPETRRRVKSN